MADGSEMKKDFTLQNAVAERMRSRRFALRYFAGIVLLTLATSVPAFANQPPGPGVSLPAILMMPMMALLTALGGGLRHSSQSSEIIFVHSLSHCRLDGNCFPRLLWSRP